MVNSTAPEQQFVDRLVKEIGAVRGKKREAVIVAGAAGFVGSRIAEAFVDLGLKVYGLDNYSTGSSTFLEGLAGNDNFELIETDLQQGVPPQLTAKKPRFIVDALDVYPHIGRTQYGLNELLNNSISLKNLLEFANKVGARVVFTSSVDIYQGLASHEYLQNYYDGKELTTYYEYLEGKRYGEALCREYVDKYELDIRVARLAEVYGPRMDFSSSSTLSMALRAVVDGKDLVFDEEGSREHQLIYVDDLVLGIVKLLFQDDPKARGGIFYFVNPEVVSTLSIAYTLKEVLKRDLRIDFFPNHRKVGYPTGQKVDITRTVKLLRWSPRINVTEGLERTLGWFTEQLKKPESASAESESKIKQIEVVPVEETGREPLADTDSSGARRGWLNGKAKTDQKTKRGRAKEGLFKQSGGRGIGGFLRLLPTKSAWKRILPDVALGVGLFVVISGLPLLLSLGFSVRGYAQINQGKADSAVTLFSQSGNLFAFYQEPARWLGLDKSYQSTRSLIAAGEYGARLASDLLRFKDDLTPIFETLQVSWQGGVSSSGYSQQDLSKYITKGSLNLGSARNWLRLAGESLSRVEIDSLPQGIGTRVTTATELIDRSERMVTNGNELLSAFPQVLGFQGMKRYIVWFQNNTELRPTGGFIGSYMAVNVENGKLADVKVDDIYNPDGLLEPHNDPSPDPILTEYLGVTSLGARDTNFSVDFPTSAAQFVTLYERATKETVDGVIALNLRVVEDLLRVIGPIELASYAETVTADNVFERAQVHAEIGFNPGSTGKKDFLGQLSSEVINRIAGLNARETQAITAVLGQELLSQNIMLFSSDAGLQDALVATGLAGKVEAYVADGIRVVDTNVGGNKANYWVKRQTQYTIDVDRNGFLSGNLRVVWDNTATSGSWPSGDYVNYVRIYLPLGVTTVIAEPALDNYREYDEFGRHVVSGVVKVPVGQKRDLSLKYSLPSALGLTQQQGYSLEWEPQAGITDEPIRFVFNTPAFLKAEKGDLVERNLAWPVTLEVKLSGIDTIATGPVPVQ